jgi:chromate reductase, NAD(P)H dehydrogenase (quinone)
MSQITILVASVGKNLELAAELEKVASEQGASTKIINLVELGLPLYSTIEEKNGIPDKACQLTKTMQESNAVMVVAPEYNGSVPPALNNAIAWISRSTDGDDWRGAFNGKPAVIATHSGGGGAHALVSMRQQLSYLGMNVLGRQLLTNYGKPLNPDSAKAVIAQLIQLGSLS